MTAVPLRRASALMFAALLVATGAAFFVTQRLKRSTPIVERVFFYQWISPNGDGRKDSVTVRFDLPKAQMREEMWKGLFDVGVLTLRSGENAIRFRPTLDLTADVVDEAMELMRKYCRRK